MATATLISVGEYLRSGYEPDRDYVDGELEDRHLGELDHNLTQRAILYYFLQRERAWNIFVIQEQRIQVSPSRFRIPDVCVYLGRRPKE